MLTTGLMMPWETCSSSALAKIQLMLKTITKKPILIKYVRQLFLQFLSSVFETKHLIIPMKTTSKIIVNQRPTKLYQIKMPQ